MSFLLLGFFSKSKNIYIKNEKIHIKKKPYFEVRESKFFPHSYSTPNNSIH